MAGRLMAPDQMTEHCLSNDDSTAPPVTNISPSFKNGPENEDMNVNSVHKCAQNDFKVISGGGTVSRVEKKNAGLIVNKERDKISTQEPLELADSTRNKMVSHLVKTHPDNSDSFVGDYNPISPETSSSEVATNGGENNDKEVSQNEQEISESDIDYLEDMRVFEQMDNAGQPKGPMEWIMRQMSMDTDPRDIITHLIPGVMVPNHLDDLSLWKGIWELITEPKARTKLNDVNTIEDVIKLIEKSKKIIVLTGAGVSVSCGIPDFRSRDGIYARLSKDFPDLPDPQSMFDIHYFRRDQRPFFKFAKEIYPGQFKPSLSHMFIAALDKKGKLLRNYTQNIDTLEQTAGIERVVQCHGSFATASCTNCKYKVASDVIRDDIFNQVIPTCENCSPDESTLAVMKPDIIFFGEGLPDAFYQNLDVDKHEADLLIVIGSSLKVRPVALIPDYLKPDVPQILINREPLHHFNFDVELLGNCDAVIAELCRRLGEDWSEVVQDYVMPPLDKDAIGMMFESSSESGSVHSRETVDFDAGLAGDANERTPSKDRNEYFNKNDSCSGSSDIKGNDIIDKKECLDNSSVNVDPNQVMVEDASVEVNISHIMVEGEPVETDRIKCEDESKDSLVNPAENRQSDILAANCSSRQSTKENMNPKFLPDNENNPRKRELERICEKCEMLKVIGDGKMDEKSATREVDVVEDVKIGASADSGFVGSCTESSEDSNNVERELQCTCGVDNKRVKLEPESKEDEKMTKEEPSGSELAGPSDEKDSKQTGEGIGEKRKARISLRPSSPSFNKESVMEKFENEDIFYLLVPPNRYIFHGAEIDRHISFMPESDSSSSQDDIGGSRKLLEEDDGENSNATVPEGGQLMEPSGPGSSTKIESQKGQLYGDVPSATDGESLNSVENHDVHESEKLLSEQNDVTKSVGESKVSEFNKAGASAVVDS